MATGPPTNILPRYMRPKLRLALTKPDRRMKNVYFLYMDDFEATRWFLEALKTAGDS